MTHSTRALAVAAALALSGASSGLFAQSGAGYPSESPGTAGAPAGIGGGMSDRFDTLDRDRDGTISKREASRDGSVAASFATLDASKDGKLDLGEFAQFEVEGGAAVEGGTSRLPGR